MSQTVSGRVLSIQSHVVHGYVGNKSATFPLQLLGFDVDAVNSVQFSNHTGYPVFKGQVLAEQELATLFEGLEQNKLLGNYTHLLTGYIGNVSFLQQIAKIVAKMRAANPALIYVCDPVMGDHGKLYVPEALLPIYKELIIPLADIITPNQYEAELLSGIQVRCDADIWRTVEHFHARGIKTVAISSSDCGGEGALRAFLSQIDGNRYVIDIPKQGNGIEFTGTGDLFASLLLAHTCKESNICCAFERTVATLQAVIDRTLVSVPQQVRDGSRKITAAERELKLIQSKREIEQPEIKLHARKVQ